MDDVSTRPTSHPECIFSMRCGNFRIILETFAVGGESGSSVRKALVIDACDSANSGIQFLLERCRIFTDSRSSPSRTFLGLVQVAAVLEVAMKRQLLHELQIPGQKILTGGGVLPFVLAPAEGRIVTVEELVDWIKQEKTWIEEQLRNSGAILFRGCDVKNAEDFNAVVEAFDYEERLYTGGLGQRSHVVGRIYTANDAPAHVYIPFHHELSQLPTSPSKVFFFCDIEPTKGGETPLLWSNAVVQRLQQEHREFLQQLDEKGLIYQNFFGEVDIPDAYVVRSWKTLYKVKDRAEFEAKVAEAGGLIKLEWIDGHGVKLMTGPVPALKWDKQRQQNVFYNYMVMKHTVDYEVLSKDKEAAAFDKILFGDGSPIPKEQILACEKIMAEEKVEFNWRRGDVILIDNVAVQHSKNPCFSSRRILSSLVA